MLAEFCYILSCVSTAAFLLLWFAVVRKDLLRKQNMVKVAMLQLTDSRERCVKAQNAQEEQSSTAILSRSEDIYRQAINIYSRTFTRPWNFVPGFLMGFRKIDKNESF